MLLAHPDEGECILALVQAKLLRGGVAAGAATGVGGFAGVEDERPTLGGHRSDRSAGRRDQRGRDEVVAADHALLGTVGRDPAEVARGRQSHNTRFVAVSVERGVVLLGALEDRNVVSVDDLSPAILAVRVDKFAELVQHELATAVLAAEQPLVLRDVGAQAGGFVFELELGQCSEATQRHVENVRGLDDRQLEAFNEAIPGFGSVLRRADDGNHLVDRIEGDQETFEDVEAILRLLQSELGSADDDLEPVIDVGLAEVVEPERGGYAVDEHHIVDAEGLLERGEAIQLLEHRLRIDGRLHIDLDHEAIHVGQVGNALDTDELAVVGELLNLADHPLRTHEVGQFGHHDRLPVATGLLDVGLGPDAERTAARLIGLA